MKRLPPTLLWNIVYLVLWVSFVRLVGLAWTSEDARLELGLGALVSLLAIGLLLLHLRRIERNRP